MSTQYVALVVLRLEITFFFKKILNFSDTVPIDITFSFVKEVILKSFFQ